jgi:hypothetical protein
MLKDLLKALRNKIIDINDPVKVCGVYKEKKCAHVDGFLCNVNTCSILKKYMAGKLIPIASV